MSTNNNIVAVSSNVLQTDRIEKPCDKQQFDKERHRLAFLWDELIAKQKEDERQRITKEESAEELRRIMEEVLMDEYRDEWDRHVELMREIEEEECLKKLIKSNTPENEEYSKNNKTNSPNAR